MKTANHFLKNEKKYNGDLIWNNILTKKIGGDKLTIILGVYDVSKILQNVFSETSDKSLKTLDDIDRVQNKHMLKSPNNDDYKPRPGETKRIR